MLAHSSLKVSKSPVCYKPIITNQIQSYEKKSFMPQQGMVKKLS